MKTLEEYILNKLQEKEEECKRLKEINANLENDISKLLTEDVSVDDMEVEDLPKSKTYTVSEQPDHYYRVSFLSEYNYNDMLIYNNKTPEYLHYVLDNIDDEDVYEEFIQLKRKSSYSDEQVAVLEERTYDFLIVNFYGKKAVVFTNWEKIIDTYNVDNDTIFLSIDAAKERLKKGVISHLQSYFHYYEKEYKPKEENK